ncbi:MAG: hypothetical protein PXX73_06155 [Sideroxydans sp.]|nr:hypothetical protein [Sideroxydans sp.]
MISDALIQLGFAGVGTVIGYFLKDYIDRRKEAEARRVADRREHYRNLILCLKSLSEGSRDNDKLLSFAYPFLWLYAPDSVIRSFNKLLSRLRSEGDNPEVALEVAELILAMRRDLGFRCTRLLASEYEQA